MINTDTNICKKIKGFGKQLYKYKQRYKDL